MFPLPGWLADVESDTYRFGSFTDAEETEMLSLVVTVCHPLAFITHFNGDALLPGGGYANLGRLHARMLGDIQ